MDLGYRLQSRKRVPL